MKYPSAIFSVILFLFCSCHTFYEPQSVAYNNYRIDPLQKTDSGLSFLIAPYRDSIQGRMNLVIGYNQSLLEKKPRQNSLGFFMTDAYLYMARLKFNSTVHAAFMNNGGIRLPELPAGQITRGQIYELMPFDNLMILVKIKGSILKQYLDTLVAYDGVIASGIYLEIKNKKTTQIRVGEELLDENAEYHIVHSDYNISNSDLLKTLPSVNTGYLQRDAIIDYVTEMKNLGKNISVNLLNRIKYAE